ncbi:hypothetical protein KILIM_014_00610 [Kineosphaera limosa NBRC 100340]|uniref:Uncharacterized protein n=1 Tax=Kineosphaera limosa NBRC 100340 TaxID=1184609 RepID=K6W6V5_9MICO|nr:hypothetical protein KILIM_014_00610 [Kineosphaera limosa NBRC 100340]
MVGPHRAAGSGAIPNLRDANGRPPTFNLPDTLLADFNDVRRAWAAPRGRTPEKGGQPPS